MVAVVGAKTVNVDRAVHVGSSVGQRQCMWAAMGQIQCMSTAVGGGGGGETVHVGSNGGRYSASEQQLGRDMWAEV